MTATVGILGAGAWGTALAIAAARVGHPVLLWGRDPDHCRRIESSRENARFLAGVRLAPSIRCTNAAGELAGAGVILAAVPAQALRDSLRVTGRSIPPGVPVVICAKGIEQESGLLMSDVARAVLPNNPPAALSGPSFAADVARGLPTALTLAAGTISEAGDIADRLASPALRLYHSDDLVGVELGGAVKNVLAIACGIAQGRGLGASAGAALMARAFAELLRFGRASGARADTLMGLSGFGDLVLTCGSAQSRNFALGLALGRGEDRSTAGGGHLAEGVATAPILLAKANALAVAMPIVESVAAILAGELAIDAAIDMLLARPPGPESL